MNLIVAVDENWSIGCEGQLLFNIPEDMKYFKQKTIDQVVVMGHATFSSLPKGLPLKDRVNIVLSHNKDLQIDGALVCHNFSELKAALENYPTKEVWVIGGEKIYELMLDYCHHAYITNIDATLPADKYFPNLDKMPQWQLVERSKMYMYGDLAYKFSCYKNLKSKEM